MSAKGPLDWDTLRDDVAAQERDLVSWDDELRGARARFLLASRFRSPRQRPSRARFAVLGAALAIAASIALAIVGLRQWYARAPIAFETGFEHATGKVGALLAPPSSEPWPITFSDGTALSMLPSTRARVTETTVRGATVVLEEGSLRVAVVHHDRTNWHVAAGPFTVLVTGTKFEVRWSTVEQVLSLDLQEGSVTVLGPSLGPTGRRVSPGERLRLSAAPEGAPAPIDIAPSATAEPPTAPIARGNVARDDMTKGPTNDGAGGARGSWKALAEDGHFAEALAAAESEGFEAACRRASPSELVLLGDSARFAGSARRAEQALRLVRTRAPGTHEAAMAAFSLGRIAYDARRSYGGAARWFESYLREEPTGSLAREAAGRLIEAEQAAGDTAGAHASAVEYLAKYPAGPHAGLARAILNR